MKKVLYELLFTALSCIYISSCSLNNRYVNDDTTIVVEVLPGDHFTINGDNAKTGKKGDDFTFDIAVDDKYEFDSIKSDGTYKNNLFTVKNVQYSCSVIFAVTKIGEFVINIHNDDSKGTISISPNKDKFAFGDEIILECKEINDGKFISYSFNGPTHDYTRNGSKKTYVPFTFSKKHKMVIEKNLDIYVNYYQDNSYLLKYYGNGGFADDEEEVITADFFPSREEYYPNTLQGSRYFKRKNYILESWNTKQDGNGIRIGLGSIAHVTQNKSESIELYAQWVKETSMDCFTFSVENNICSLLSYDETKNQDSYLAIPSFYNEYPVSIIKSNAIVTHKKQLYLNNKIETIETNAINGHSVESMLFFTSLKEFKSNALDVPKCEKCYVNGESFSNNHEECVRDLAFRCEDILLSRDNRKLFLMIGHSTLYQNHNLTPLIEQYPDYNFQFFGATRGTSTKLMVELCESLLSKDDFFLFQFHENAVDVLGNGYDTFARIDLNFDCFLNVDFRNYFDCFFESYNACSKTYYVRDFETEVYTYETKHKISNRGEDVQMYKEDYDVTEDNVGPSTISIPSKYLKPGYYSFIKERLDQLKAQKKIIVWSTYNINAIEQMDSFLTFESTIRNDFSEYTFIDSITENIYTGKYFRKNDNNHLTLAGGSLRINRWAIQLNDIL